jgi:hypothetical protein
VARRFLENLWKPGVISFFKPVNFILVRWTQWRSPSAFWRFCTGAGYQTQLHSDRCPPTIGQCNVRQSEAPQLLRCQTHVLALLSGLPWLSLFRNDAFQFLPTAHFTEYLWISHKPYGLLWPYLSTFWLCRLFSLCGAINFLRSSQLGKEFLDFLIHLKLHSRVHKSVMLDRILKRINLIRIISLRSVLILSWYLCLGLQNDLFHSEFWTTVVCVLLLSTCNVHI